MLTVSLLTMLQIQGVKVARWVLAALVTQSSGFTVRPPLEHSAHLLPLVVLRLALILFSLFCGTSSAFPSCGTPRSLATGRRFNFFRSSGGMLGKITEGTSILGYVYHWCPGTALGFNSPFTPDVSTILSRQAPTLTSIPSGVRECTRH